jgi:hypothetical protein
MSSQSVCKACILLEGLNKGLPTLGVSRTRTRQQQLAALSGSRSSGRHVKPGPIQLSLEPDKHEHGAIRDSSAHGNAAS